MTDSSTEQKPRHTPGPWVHAGRVKPVGDADKEGIVNLFCGDVSPAAKDYRGEICSIQSADHIRGISREEALANARLIAAAPDLLAACRPRLNDQARRLLEATIEAEREVGDPEVAVAIELLLKWQEDARAAVTKAEG